MSSSPTAATSGVSVQQNHPEFSETASQPFQVDQELATKGEGLKEEMLEELQWLGGTSEAYTDGQEQQGLLGQLHLEDIDQQHSQALGPDR